MPYLIRIFGVKLLMDMPVNVTHRQKARSGGVVVSLREYTELIDILGEQLELPSMRFMTLRALGGVCMMLFS
ncbi:hypothetical protein [Vulcanisaeta distributa]|uniref:hypothetical protein n=1 Tax=Vulcanisaeta distributa TaxID=164451 RepID=UPI000ACEFAB6|nr:hypothetical protein [Vulcanisaeta distributa]